MLLTENNICDCLIDVVNNLVEDKSYTIVDIAALIPNQTDSFIAYKALDEFKPLATKFDGVFGALELLNKAGTENDTLTALIEPVTVYNELLKYLAEEYLYDVLLDMDFTTGDLFNSPVIYDKNIKREVIDILHDIIDDPIPYLVAKR